jgi:hypothetical protein
MVVYLLNAKHLHFFLVGLFTHAPHAQQTRFNKDWKSVVITIPAHFGTRKANG